MAKASAAATGASGAAESIIASFPFSASHITSSTNKYVEPPIEIPNPPLPPTNLSGVFREESVCGHLGANPFSTPFQRTFIHPFPTLVP